MNPDIFLRSALITAEFVRVASAATLPIQSPILHEGSDPGTRYSEREAGGTVIPIESTLIIASDGVIKPKVFITFTENGEVVITNTETNNNADANHIDFFAIDNTPDIIITGHLNPADGSNRDTSLSSMCGVGPLSNDSGLSPNTSAAARCDLGFTNGDEISTTLNGITYKVIYNGSRNNGVIRLEDQDGMPIIIDVNDPVSMQNLSMAVGRLVGAATKTVTGGNTVLTPEKVVKFSLSTIKLSPDALELMQHTHATPMENVSPLPLAEIKPLIAIQKIIPGPEKPTPFPTLSVQIGEGGTAYILNPASKGNDFDIKKLQELIRLYFDPTSTFTDLNIALHAAMASHGGFVWFYQDPGSMRQVLPSELASLPVFHNAPGIPPHIWIDSSGTPYAMIVDGNKNSVILPITSHAVVNVSGDTSLAREIASWQKGRDAIGTIIPAEFTVEADHKLTTQDYGNFIHAVEMTDDLKKIPCQLVPTSGGLVDKDSSGNSIALDINLDKPVTGTIIGTNGNTVTIAIDMLNPFNQHSLDLTYLSARYPDVTWGRELILVVSQKYLTVDPKDMPFVVSSSSELSANELPVYSHSSGVTLYETVRYIRPPNHPIDPDLTAEFGSKLKNGALWLALQEARRKAQKPGSILI